MIIEKSERERGPFFKKCALTLQETLDLPSFVSTLRPCVHNRTYLAKENTLITEYQCVI